VALADTLVDDYDVIDLLHQLIAHCVALRAADASGILLRPRQQPAAGRVGAPTRQP
jgi:hypothetical protein